MKYSIKIEKYECKLYYGNTCIGVVRQLDYNEEEHGYGISKVTNYKLLDDFQREANRLYFATENPCITYLDKLMQ